MVHNVHHAVATPHRHECRQGLFGLGVPEIAVIAGVAALIFGPSKLPELGKAAGQTAKSFQDAAKEFNEELKKGMEVSILPALPVRLHCVPLLSMIDHCAGEPQRTAARCPSGQQQVRKSTGAQVCGTGRDVRGS